MQVRAPVDPFQRRSVVWAVSCAWRRKTLRRVYVSFHMLIPLPSQPTPTSQQHIHLSDRSRPMAQARQLLAVAACLASLLAMVHWMERPSSGRMLATNLVPASSVATTADKAAAAATGGGGRDQCTIVFIHNRKGCVFGNRTHLWEAGADAAIANPTPEGVAGWAAAPLSGGNPDHHHHQQHQQRLKRPPKGQPFGPPQKSLWKVCERGAAAAAVKDSNESSHDDNDCHRFTIILSHPTTLCLSAAWR